MNKVLVTGAAGNVGSALVDSLIQIPNYYVLGVDNLLSGDMQKINSLASDNFDFIKADVNNYNEISSIMLSHRFDYVFHYAAVVGVQRTLNNPIQVLNDVDGIKNVLNLSKNTGVKRVFYSSSSEVYGEPVEFPQNEETTPLNSRLPYAVVKNIGEALLKSYQREYGLDFTIFRFFNTYGPKQSEDFVVKRFLKQALEGKPITIYGDGSQTRTFCYIDDNTSTVISCLINRQFINDIINIGNDEEISIRELADLILKVTGSKSKINFLPPLKEGDMSRRKPDNSRMISILNRPLITLEEGLRKTIQMGYL